LAIEGDSVAGAGVDARAFALESAVLGACCGDGAASDLTKGAGDSAATDLDCGAAAVDTGAVGGFDARCPSATRDLGCSVPTVGAGAVGGFDADLAFAGDANPSGLANLPNPLGGVLALDPTDSALAGDTLDFGRSVPDKSGDDVRGLGG